MAFKTNCIIGYVLFSTFILAQKANDNFTGRWKAPKGDIIRVYKTKHSFIGKTVNEGTVVLKNVKFADGKWTAIIMNPREKIIADCELILETGKLKIIAKMGVFQKTLYWEKQ
jgi:hypothetical protein